MKKAFLWFYFMNKRLYRKITFAGLVLLIPILVFGFSVAARQTGGIVSITLAREDPEDVTAAAIIHQLMEDSQVITFITTTPENAVELVKDGKADGAWIFPKDTARFVLDYSRAEASGFIRVVERQETVALRLAREKLSGAIYTPTVQMTYLQYLREYAPETESVSDEVLLGCLEQTHVSGDLFTFYDVNGNLRESSENYLYTPLRGLLAILMVICAAVTAVYYQKDRDAGRFSLLPEEYHILTEFAYQAVSAVNMILVIYICLLNTGLYQKLWQEAVLGILYSICCCMTGMLLRRVFSKILPAVLPGFLAVLLVGCPVFFDLAALRPVSVLLPPTYFIQGGYNGRYLLYLSVYNLILGGVVLLWEQISKLKFTKS